MPHPGARPTNASMSVAEAVAIATDALGRVMDIEASGAAIVETSLVLTGAASAWLHDVFEDAHELRLAAFRGPELAPDERLRVLRLDGPSLVARAARARRIESVAAEGERSLASSDAGAIFGAARCAIATPLLVGDRLLGVVTCAFEEPRRPLGEDVALLRAVGSVAAWARAGAFDAAVERRLRAELEAIRAAALSIAEPMDLRSALACIAREARALADAEYGALGVAGPDVEVPFDPWVYDGMTPEQDRAIGRHPRPVGLLRVTALEGQSLRIPDAEAEPRFQGVPPHHPAMHAFLGVPIVSAGRSVGNLYLANKRGGGEFSREDQRAIELLAQHAALALEHAWAHDRAAGEVTALRRANEALELSEARLNRIIDDAPIGMAIVDLDGCFLRVNRALAEIVGHRPEELVRMRWQDITHPEDLEADLAQVHRLLRGELDRYQLGKRYLHKDGSEVDVLLSVSVLRDHAGAPLHFISQIEDVTDRKRIEEALRESERHLRALFDNAVEAIVVMDNEGLFVDANPAASQLFALPHAALLGRRFSEFVSEEPAAKTEERTRRLLAEGQLKEDICVRSADHRMMDVEYTARAHFVPGRHLGMLRDVTGRRRAEAAVADERRWLRAVIERSPVSILISEDREARWITANRRAEELFGKPLPREGGMAQYLGCVFDKEGGPLDIDDAPGNRALRGESTSGEELLIRRPDGSMVPVLVSAGPIRDERGRVIGAVAIHDDMTRVKELERLRQEWTSMVAHDLRQPVTIIHGYAGLLARSDDAAVRTRAAHIFASAQRLSRMIDDLLDVSRLEARRLPLSRAPSDLVSLIKAAVERASAETLGHRVEVEVKGALTLVDIDPGRVEQVLGNLLSNAAKYGAPGADIQVFLEPYDGAVRVSVVNRGPGISTEDLARLFERFQRGAAAGTKVVGVGLGLCISKGLVEAHGGRMWAESTPGERTSFHFTLPAIAERV